MKLKFSTRFYLESRKDKETKQIITENVPIFIFFTFDGKRLQHYAGYRIDVDKWETSTQRVKRNNSNKDGITSTDINSHLVKLQSYVEDIYQKAKANEFSPSIDYIRDELKKRLKDGEKPNGKGFFDYFNEFVELEGKANTWTKGTYTKFHTNIAHLKAFEAKHRKKLTFDNLDETFFSKWHTFQREELDHRNTYIAKNQKILKWFLKWATRKGYNKNTYFESYKPELKGSKRNSKIIFLTWPELLNLYEMPIRKKYLEQVRDVFCFCCFSGLRYSDVYNLKRSNIKTDTIEFTTIKTDDSLSVDINDYSRAILAKYANIPFKNDKCLPVISNQKMNEYLKELGKVAGIETPETVVYFKGAERIEQTFKKYELLSTHVGRKTFVTNALFFNIPAEVVMAWTGHKDHKVMENYYKVIDQQKNREMKKFNKQ
jgi:integrase